MTPARDHEGESLPRAVGPRVKFGEDTEIADLDGDRIVLDVPGDGENPFRVPVLRVGIYNGPDGAHGQAVAALDEAGVRALIGSLWSGWQRLTEGDGT